MVIVEVVPSGVMRRLICHHSTPAVKKAKEILWQNTSISSIISWFINVIVRFISEMSQGQMKHTKWTWVEGWTQEHQKAGKSTWWLLAGDYSLPRPFDFSVLSSLSWGLADVWPFYEIEGTTQGTGGGRSTSPVHPEWPRFSYAFSQSLLLKLGLSK